MFGNHRSPRDGGGDVRGADRSDDLQRIFSCESLKLSGQERFEGEVPAVLLPHDHHQRSVVDSGCGDAADGVTESRRRVDEGEGRPGVGDRIAGGYAEHRSFMQRQYKMEIVRQVGKERNFR